MSRKQQAEYDRTVKTILNRFGSTNAVAIQSHQITNEIVTGETIRLWFKNRKIPAEFVFVLYEMMDREIDPLTLLPWLRRFVELK